MKLFQPNPMFTAIVILALLVWLLGGLLVFDRYARSTVELHKRVEFVLAVVCGPIVWWALLLAGNRDKAEDDMEG